MISKAATAQQPFARAFPFLAALRPRQWTKNAFVLAALIFSLQFTDPTRLAQAGLAFVVFCALSAAAYLFNDIVDRDLDRLHPTKKFRPIASGAVSLPVAAAGSAGLATIAVAAAFALRPTFGLLAVAFVALMLAYSFALKRIPIIDCLAIALGFTIRVVAGAIAIDVPFSVWFVLTAFFLAFFLASEKRHRESRTIGSAGRNVLDQYDPVFLSEMTNLAMGITITIYTFFTFSSSHSNLLVVTVPFVVYGLLRYRFRALKADGRGDGPADDLLADPWLIGTIAVWATVSVSILWLG